MKKFRCLLAVILILGLLAGCGSGTAAAPQEGTAVLATTYPVYYLTSRLLEGVDGVTVEAVVTEPVSCVHDYSITTTQMKRIEQADLVVLSGAGLEHFMASALKSVPEADLVDSSAGIELLDGDLHIWLDPENYARQGQNIAGALVQRYPEYAGQVSENEAALTEELTALKAELCDTLSGLACRKLVTFHDGFGYFAKAFDLTIAAAIEEEEGAEAPASEIKAICDLIAEEQIPAIFVEKNGSTNAAEIISRETGVGIFALNTVMDGQSDYVDAMRENVEQIKEALS